MITIDLVKRLKQLCKSASGTPWEIETVQIDGRDVFTGRWLCEYGAQYWQPGAGCYCDHKNAELVAEMRNTFLDLLELAESSLKEPKFRVLKKKGGCRR